MIGSAIFIAYAFNMLWLPRMVDVVGRRRFLLFGITLNVAIFTAVFFTSNLYVVIGLMFCFGTCVSVRGVGVIYMLELMPKDSVVFMGTMYTSIDAVFNLLIVVYFWVVSTNWIYLFSVAYAITIMAAIGAWTLLTESP